MLREGQEYFFRVQKEITTPDNKNHYVLFSPDKRRLLLPKEPYSYYGITLGRRIKCRVDRISCKGEIYLEPVSPYYKEGKSYFFEIKDVGTRTDYSGREITVYFVNDRYGRQLTVPAGTPVRKKGERIKLAIERISKGRLHIIHDISKRGIINLDPDLMFEFFVEKTAKGLDGEDYFVITDPLGSSHLLAVRYYEYYGLKPGGKFKGKVVKYKDTGEKIIEPVNPFYREDEVIKVKLTSVDRNSINGTFTLELTDKYGRSHCMETDHMPAKLTLLCRVTGIRKGRPILELL